MSIIEYTKDDMVTLRTGEFYPISSCYTTPHSLDRSQKEYNYEPDIIVSNLFNDIDELMNKPRRFFDHLLSIVEYKRDHDQDIDLGNHREYWNEMIKGCELWLCAVENGLYGEAIRLADEAKKEQLNTPTEQPEGHPCFFCKTGVAHTEQQHERSLAKGEQPDDLRAAIESKVIYAIVAASNNDVDDITDTILRLCEAAVLAAKPEEAVETDKLGKDYKGYARGHNAATEAYQANIHSVFGGKL
jgi:hypothetical protein